MKTKNTLGRREFPEKATQVFATVAVGAGMKPVAARAETPGRPAASARNFSGAVARWAFTAILTACRATGVAPSAVSVQGTS